jgi:hypothetical protein
LLQFIDIFRRVPTFLHPTVKYKVRGLTDPQCAAESSAVLAKLAKPDMKLT